MVSTTRLKRRLGPEEEATSFSVFHRVNEDTKLKDFQKNLFSC